MRKLKVLIIEDSADDIELLKKVLSSLPYQITFVEAHNAVSTRQMLADKNVDLVISDHSMPGYDAVEALEIFKEHGLDVPFIIYSNVIGEEAAVEAMRAGASDYVMKVNPFRLLPAVERELRESTRRRERKSLEEKLRLSHGLFEKVFNSPLIGLFFTDEKGNILEANQKFLEMIGYSRNDLSSGRLTLEFITANELKSSLAATQAALESSGQTTPAKSSFLRASGGPFPVITASAKVDHPVYRYVTYAIES